MKGCRTLVLLSTLALLAAQLGAEGTKDLAEVSPLLSGNSSLAECLDSFLWGLNDSKDMVIDVTRSCLFEEREDVLELVDDAQYFLTKTSKELREAVDTACKKQAGRDVLGCAAAVLRVAVPAAVPVLQLVLRAVVLYVRLAVLPFADLMGCILLPAVLPAITNTILDFAILVQCIFS